MARHLPLHDHYSEEPRFFVRVARSEGSEGPGQVPEAKIIGKSKDEVELQPGPEVRGLMLEFTLETDLFQ